MHVKQCKGKDLTKLPAKIDKDSKEYYWSIKYDGHYVQVYVGPMKEVRFYTSSGKEFYVPELAEHFKQLPPLCIYECEFVGHSEGKLGDRTAAGILTTWRTDFKKNIVSTYNGEKIYIFDYIDLHIPSAIFEKRLNLLKDLKKYNNESIKVVDYKGLISIKEALVISSQVCTKGYEGIMLKHKEHVHKFASRVNTAIKIKQRKTADLVCIATLEGEGKYEGQIGSLVLKDSRENIVKVGSGLTDFDRQRDPNYYIGKIVEISYDSFKDTYLQPVFISIREDKLIKDID